MLKNTMIIAAALALLAGPAIASGDANHHRKNRSAEYRQHEQSEHRNDGRLKSEQRYERHGEDHDDDDDGHREHDRRKDDDHHQRRK